MRLPTTLPTASPNRLTGCEARTHETRMTRAKHTTIIRLGHVTTQPTQMQPE